MLTFACAASIPRSTNWRFFPCTKPKCFPSLCELDVIGLVPSQSILYSDNFKMMRNGLLMHNLMLGLQVVLSLVWSNLLLKQRISFNITEIMNKPPISLPCSSVWNSGAIWPLKSTFVSLVIQTNPVVRFNLDKPAFQRILLSTKWNWIEEVLVIF